jgi:thiol-disulfide isomerase/thioredoxin
MMFKRILATLLLLTSAYAKTPRPIGAVPINMGDGKKTLLSSYKGKVVLFAIFSTGCDHCINSLGLLDRLQKRYGPRGFQAFAAIGDDNAPYLLVPFKQRYKPTYPVGYLNRDGIQKIGDIGPDVRPFVPIYMFIDRTGTVRFQFYGNDPFFNDEDKATSVIIQNLLR